MAETEGSGLGLHQLWPQLGVEGGVEDTTEFEYVSFRCPALMPSNSTERYCHPWPGCSASKDLGGI
jgi:hypothetical protein